jgi:hypothetical protein
MIRCVRMWTGEDGDSLFEEGWIDLSKGTRGDCIGEPVPVVELSSRKRARAGHTSGTRIRSRLSSSPCPARSNSRRSLVRRSPSTRATSCSPRTTAARATSGSPSATIRGAGPTSSTKTDPTFTSSQADKANDEGTTLRGAALATGCIDAADFDRIVNPTAVVGTL